MCTTDKKSFGLGYGGLPRPGRAEGTKRISDWLNAPPTESAYKPNTFATPDQLEGSAQFNALNASRSGRNALRIDLGGNQAPTTAPTENDFVRDFEAEKETKKKRAGQLLGIVKARKN